MGELLIDVCQLCKFKIVSCEIAQIYVALTRTVPLIIIHDNISLIISMHFLSWSISISNLFNFARINGGVGVAVDERLSVVKERTDEHPEREHVGWEADPAAARRASPDGAHHAVHVRRLCRLRGFLRVGRGQRWGRVAGRSRELQLRTHKVQVHLPAGRQLRIKRLQVAHLLRACSVTNGD